MAVTEFALLTLQPSAITSTSTTTRRFDFDQQQQQHPEGSPPKIKDSLLHNLAQARQVLTKSCGHPFQLFRSIEHHLRIYLIGGWDTIAQHRTNFLPSTANKTLLELLKDDVVVESMIHLDIDQDVWPVVKFFDDNVHISVDDFDTGIGTGSDVVLAIARYQMSNELNKRKFREIINKTVGVLKGFVEQQHRNSSSISPHVEAAAGAAAKEGDQKTKGLVVGGWMIDESEKKDSNREFVLFTAWPSVDAHMAFAKTDEFVEYSKIRDFCDVGVEIEHARLLRL